MRQIYPVAADLENAYGHAPGVAAETICFAGEVAGLFGGSIEDSQSRRSFSLAELAALGVRRIGVGFALSRTAIGALSVRHGRFVSAAPLPLRKRRSLTPS